MFASAPFAILALAVVASAQTWCANCTAPWPSAVLANDTYTTVTSVLAGLTTYCPYATSFEVAGHTWVVTEATTITFTDCPCTFTHVVPSSLVSATAAVQPPASQVPGPSPTTTVAPLPTPPRLPVVQPVMTAAAGTIALPARLGFVAGLGAAVIGAVVG